MLVIKFSFLQPKIPKVWLSIDKKNVVGKCQMSLTFWLIDQSGLIPWQVDLLLFFWSLPHTIASVLSDILSCTCDESLETKKIVKSLLENARRCFSVAVLGKCHMSVTFWLIDQSGPISWQVDVLSYFWYLPHTFAGKVLSITVFFIIL